ncbi:hypothetical protein CC1G_04402 [Coprinopsis cinerea okayama7|uniref:C3H1-type domain-containing protein n=1 Tax=Coprinopsis cinerea (strain Okayama-7 / 130 / ATCC MYA-4618 / FGSC 9003) TaxID=240176 RepID=A8N0I1_COPC7|nr:hypothetical protein CC1G_04402 [Coprinopsis cinerea okayama7\|eukprot:XP_001828431.1 hypothetical protein CC1G_04402 [Coprinopsis cinerea okayama7\
MPARTENSDQRWRLNHNGQLVDAEATAGWELADEIVRLKIAEVSGNADDIVPIRTPPKSKFASAGVAQLNSDSPPDVASNPSSNSSPHSSEHQISISHSRGSSIDTTSSVASNNRLNGTHNIKPANSAQDAKERPHSFTGGLSNADLRRLQQVGGDDPQWIQSNELSYPSLAQNHVHRPQPQQHPSMYEIRNSQPSEREDSQQDYIQQPRPYNAPAPHPSYLPPANGMPYRRGFQGQGMVPGASPIPYPTHTSHLSLGNTQQLYEMMLPGAMHDNHHPAVNRVQQQHGVFRATHHHSASDPSSLRDAAALALLNSNMQFGPGMFPPPPGLMYANQYYGGQDVAALMAARLQAQYTGPYNVPPAPGPPAQPPVPAEPANPISPSSTGTGGGNQSSGPSANNRKLGLYKTELCRSWEEKGSCRYGSKCQFAHGEEELRKVQRHPKYKTEICRTFWVSGSCPYGKRCCFIHTELPSSGATPPAGAGSTTESTTSQSDGRPRSMSTNSDPNDASTSLLARIKNSANGSPKNGSSGGAATPVESNNSNFQFNSRPPTGSLRVDTSVLDGSVKQPQNKSAYPTFASNGILLPASEPITAKEAAPVTAGPDLGRYNAAARREIVGYNPPQPGHKNGHGTRGNPRHSFSGEIDLGFNPSPPATANSYGLTSPDGGSNAATPTTGSSSGSARVNGHVRGGSAGNWSTLVRSGLSSSGYTGSNQAGDIMTNSPWNDITVGGSARAHWV